MDSIASFSRLPAVTDVYTDVQGLQQLAAEDDKDASLKKIAQQFESMFIHMMLKSMRQANAVFEEDSMFNSKESEFYRDMHDQQLSLTMAHKNGIGIADAMYRQMSGRYGIPKSGDEDAKTAIDAFAFRHKGIPISKSDLDFGVKHKEGEVGAINRVALATSPEEFISKVMPAIRKAADALGVEAEFIAAQAALETGWGSKILADEQGKSSNNLFNIKKDSDWQGDTITVSTLEYKKGTFKPEKAEFKSYETLADSIQDYVTFLTRGSRYQKALDSAGEGLDFIKGLQKAGYATDPNYAEKIFSVYKRISEAASSVSSNGSVR